MHNPATATGAGTVVVAKMTTTSSDYAIRTQGLSKSYRSKTALEDLSFTIDEPGILGLLGRNGAGKTTLMRLCAGRIEKSAGVLEVWGAAPLNNLEVLSQLIYSYPHVAYPNSLRLQAILKDYKMLFPQFDLKFAEGLLSYFDIDAKRRYFGLSQGTKGIFNFICALAARTPLTMLDEPTLGMDVTVRKAIYEILMREYSENPRTFIVSSHLMGELEGALNSILILDEGKLVLHDSIESMRESAYQIQGDGAIVERYCVGRKVIHQDVGEMSSTAVIYESANDKVMAEIQVLGLRLSAVRPEELFTYLTRENKGGDLSCLWNQK